MEVPAASEISDRASPTQIRPMSYETRIRLSKDQPLLRRKPRRAPKGGRTDRAEIDFWKHFNVDKFAQDWRRGVGKRS